MPKPKTAPHEASVEAFLESVSDARARNDATQICAWMSAATRAEPKMWGKAIVGFGAQKLVYPNGRELDWFVMGLSPRKGKTTLYLGLADDDYSADIAALGKCQTGKGCLYIRSLEDVDGKALKKLLTKVAKKKG